VTDEEAPFVETETGSTPFNSGNTYPSTYDVLGRVFTVGATVKF
jgi:iron complex outermembrane receptor protein